MLAETGIVLMAVPYRCTAKPNLALQSVSYIASLGSHKASPPILWRVAQSSARDPIVRPLSSPPYGCRIMKE